MDRPDIFTLAMACLASAVSVPVSVIACEITLVLASSVDGLDGYAVLGIMILAHETMSRLASVAWFVAGATFLLFPATAILMRDRPWLRLAVLPSLGSAVGAIIGAHGNLHAAATWLGAVAGLIASGVFAFVGRDC